MVLGKSFLGALLLIIFVGLFLRLYVVAGDNLFFTVDQGRDAVYVREILTHGRIFLKGPETNIRGIFAGPLGDYFIAVGYLISGGHPFGGVLMMIAINIVLTVLLILWLRKKVGKVKALLAGAALQLYWPFFETSLWGFHPFPLVLLSFILIFLLTRFVTLYHRTSTVVQKENSRYYYWAIVPVLVAFNFEVAGAMALFIFYFIVGIYGVRKKLISARLFAVIGILLPSLGTLFLARQFIFGIFSSKATQGASGAQVFSGTNFQTMTVEFAKMMGTLTVPQNLYLGILVLGVIVFFFVKHQTVRTGSDPASRFILLVLFLTLISFLFFSLTLGWRSWQTVYLPPLVFVSVLLMLTQIPKKIGILFFALIMIFQIANFKQKYLEYLKPQGNPSLLYNQLATVDWIYQKSESQGFRAYNYTDTFYDYPYQYLFWWKGLQKYGYLPDEYANFPLSHKALYIPGYEDYSQPARSGLGLKYLVIQSNTNGEDNADWPEKFRFYHDLVDQTKIGDIRIEKYIPKNEAPSDLCIWWGQCNLLEQNQISR